MGQSDHSEIPVPEKTEAVKPQVFTPEQEERILQIVAEAHSKAHQA